MNLLNRMIALLVLMAFGLGTLESAPAALIGQWEFESVNAGVTPDSTGNGHDGTLVGDAAIINDPDRGSVLSLTGIASGNGYVDINSILAIPNLAANSGATLTAWIKRNDAAGDDNIGGDVFANVVGLGTSGNNPTFAMSINSPSNVVQSFVEGDGGSDQAGFAGDISVQDDVWTHIAVVIDRVNNVGITYVNGVAQTNPADISIVGDGELDWAFGRIGELTNGSSSDINHFGGLIDDVRYYDEVLTQSQVAQTMIPEPGSLVLLGLGGWLMLARRR